MTGLNKDQVEELQWCDVELHAMTWGDSGRDLSLHLRSPATLEAGEQFDRIVWARWVRGLRLDLQMTEGTSGYPTTWDVAFERDQSGVWSVVLDFGAVGSVSFLCSELDLVDQA